MHTLLRSFHWIPLFLLILSAGSYAQDQRQDCACVLYVSGLNGSEKAIMAETWA
jgi:hypothetical protein